MNKTIGYFEFVTSENEVIPMKFGLYCLETLCSNLNTTPTLIGVVIQEHMAKQPIKTLTRIALAGANTYALAMEGVDDKYLFKDAMGWFEDVLTNDDTRVAKMMDSFTKSLQFPNDVEALDEDVEEAMSGGKQRKKKTS